ncbi:anaphase-promoting complex subunit Cut9 [Schizosaccharomyces japonicus yFS275]|uniref:Anaphase-promoting complex subunit Cut9 n=1 Tax=Schizosaccharomyces japonicus (strain yFS275 / FY16936) TaxID=402676 RepID=B6K403_SCHJY|nr:anaphase-promoting complex subunit Cut9 [Schizosaccharomyces japonicus yFS275]EEB08210.2 anaphase-promoting complex subunit Cut9 [Schizosaccharomyces japonicus yFS275]
MANKRNLPVRSNLATPTSYSHADARSNNCYMTPPSFNPVNPNQSNSQISTLTISPVPFYANSPYDKQTPKPDRNQLNAFNVQKVNREDLLRMWRHDALMQEQYDTAMFVGETVLSITNDPNDAFWLAKVYCSTHNYARAKSLLLKQDLLNQSSACRYLAALCCVKLFDWQGALSLLGEENPFRSGTGKLPKLKMQDGGIKLEASMCYLRGVVYTNLNNFDKAKDCYKEAVLLDTKCFEAFNQLVSNHLLTVKEEWELVNSLDFTAYSKEDADFLRAMYTLKINKLAHEDELSRASAYLSSVSGLKGSADLLLCRAEVLFVKSCFRDALKLTSQILENDPYKLEAYPVHLACLHELGEKNKLFLIAHDLTDKQPTKAVTWLAVGIYYLCVKKITEARRFFSKASTMDPHFGPAWIGFAHSFAVEGEHDQAISAYTTASRLFQGAHLPYLFLGMQHMQLGNMLLADEYLKSSYELCQHDPLLLNEMGVLAFNKGDMQQAIKWFRSALKLVKKTQGNETVWAATWANLGHAYRKLKMYDPALEAFQQGLYLSSRDANIHTAISLIYLLKKNPAEAIKHLHESLAISPAETVSSDLLKRALEENASASNVSDVNIVFEDSGSESMQSSSNDFGSNVEMSMDQNLSSMGDSLVNSTQSYLDSRSELNVEVFDNAIFKSSDARSFMRRM